MVGLLTRPARWASLKKTTGIGYLSLEAGPKVMALSLKAGLHGMAPYFPARTK
jgi:hypothetical protein